MTQVKMSDAFTSDFCYYLYDHHALIDQYTFKRRVEFRETTTYKKPIILELSRSRPIIVFKYATNKGLNDTFSLFLTQTTPVTKHTNMGGAKQDCRDWMYWKSWPPCATWTIGTHRMLIPTRTRTKSLQEESDEGDQRKCSLLNIRQQKGTEISFTVSSLIE